MNTILFLITVTIEHTIYIARLARFIELDWHSLGWIDVTKNSIAAGQIIHASSNNKRSKEFQSVH